MRVRELKIRYEPRPDLPAIDLRTSLKTPREAAAFLMPIFEKEPAEVFLAVFVTTKHSLIGFHEVSRGTLDATHAHPREIFRAAFLANAAGVILAHNHPSGDPTPSPDDVALTCRLRQAGEILGVEVLDHVIVAEDRYYSFKEGGRL